MSDHRDCLLTFVLVKKIPNIKGSIILLSGSGRRLTSSVVIHWLMSFILGNYWQLSETFEPIAFFGRHWQSII